MTFNSLPFALFLPIFLILFYACCTKQRLRDVLLLTGSYFFYMSWYWQYAGLIALSTIVDFAIGRKLHYETNEKKRKLLVLASLVLNLGILAIFKYFNFFFDASRSMFALFGIDIPEIYHQLLLPVGISFYTFQTLSYTLDIYRKNLKPEHSFVKFAVFVSFFPQLVAGPIVRAKDFLPQIDLPTKVSAEQWESGLKLVFIGLFKKIVIADLLAYLAVDAVFENPSAYSSWDLLIGLYAYTFQIYCDFSGYSDIAIGVALMLGFILPPNFNRPYLAQSPSDFWKRWHISLSSWLRDYLYISLGGNRGSTLFTARNLMITMVLGGLWHGAAFNFILWGAFHGCILIFTRNIVVESQFNGKMLAKILINFHLIVFSWLLFRVTSIENFTDYVSGFFQFTGGSQFNGLLYGILGLAALVHFTPRSLIDRAVNKYLDPMAIPLKSLVYVGLIFLFVGASIGAPSFIYFQF
ncbi:MAG: MBOAT family protein [Ketobacter sp.]|nr:MBOAT family protein [Ketobacter sp.]